MADRTTYSLRPSERHILALWTAQYRPRLDVAWYNVRLGFGLPSDPSSPDWLRRLASVLTRRRADVIALDGSRVVIIELKERVGLNALGQLLGYASLFLDFVSRRDAYRTRLGDRDADVRALLQIAARLNGNGWRDVTPHPLTFMRNHPGLLRMIAVGYSVAPDVQPILDMLSVDLNLVER
jgi:hypothetical protein